MKLSKNIGGKNPPTSPQTHRFAYLLSDETFKVVVCTEEHEDIVIGILELLLPDKHISRITFLNKEKHGSVVSEKNVTFDLLCMDADTGEEFLVEMQQSNQASYMDRVLTYSTYPVREQMERRLHELIENKDPEGVPSLHKRKMDYTLNPVYVISLINFELPHQDARTLEDGYISRYELRNGHTGELMTASLNFVFLEMGRLRYGAAQWSCCRGRLERLVFLLKHMHELSEVPEGLEDPLLSSLFRASELANMKVKERQHYDKIMTTEIDRIAQLDYAQARGKAEGKAESAKNLKRLGVDESVICEATGLTAEEVAAL